MNLSKNRDIAFRLVITWLVILIVFSFWLTLSYTPDVVIVAVSPQIPRENEPVIATFKLNNPYTDVLAADYQFYVNGSLFKDGTTLIAPNSSKTFQYTHRNTLSTGEQINFMARVQTVEGSHEEMVSLPPYPPQILSSFVSFASYSTTVMSSLHNITYYQSTFGSSGGVNLGIIITLVFCAVLAFMELTQAVAGDRTITTLARIRIQFSTLSSVLFVIFVGMVITRAVMIIAG